MNNCCEITIDASEVSSDEVFTIDINNRFTFGAYATRQDNPFMLTILDEPSSAEFTAAARRLFSSLDQEERDTTEG
jgi:hypothetical protein